MVPCFPQYSWKESEGVYGDFMNPRAGLASREGVIRVGLGNPGSISFQPSHLLFSVQVLCVSKQLFVEAALNYFRQPLWAEDVSNLSNVLISGEVGDVSPGPAQRSSHH